MEEKERKLPRAALKLKAAYEKLHGDDGRSSGQYAEETHTYPSGAGRTREYRVVKPQGTPKGTIIDVHGGMWTGGSVLRNAAYRAHLASEGWLVIAPDLGHLPELDLAGLIRNLSNFFTHLSERPDFDRDDLFITSDGTGSYLALLYEAVSQHSMYRVLCHIETAPRLRFRAIGMSQPILYLTELQGLPKTLFGNGRDTKEILTLLTRYENVGESPAKRIINFTRFASKITLPPLFMILDPASPWTQNCEKPLRTLEKKEMDHTVYDDIREKGLEPAFNVHSPGLEVSAKANDAMLKFFEEHIGL